MLHQFKQKKKDSTESFKRARLKPMASSCSQLLKRKQMYRAQQSTRSFPKAEPRANKST
jgi:hypothetical protein